MDDIEVQDAIVELQQEIHSLRESNKSLFVTLATLTEILLRTGHYTANQFNAERAKMEQTFARQLAAPMN